MLLANLDNSDYYLFDVQACVEEARIRIDRVNPEMPVILTLYGALEARIDRERLTELEISFAFRGNEYYFRVARVRDSIPYDLELEPVNRDVADFKKCRCHVAHVAEIKFHKNGTELFRMMNASFNPETLD